MSRARRVRAITVRLFDQANSGGSERSTTSCGMIGLEVTPRSPLAAERQTFRPPRCVDKEFRG